MFFILFFLILILVIIWNSKIEIQINNLDITIPRKEIKKRDSEVYLKIIIFNKIPILKINLKKLKGKKINIGAVIERAKKLEEKGNKQKWLISLVKSLKDFKLEIKEADVKIKLGTEDAALTAITVGLVASILGIILNGKKFEITPVYQDKNILNIKLNCIFRLNLMHYIYKTISKGRDENERKPSNRRSYAYSNE